MLMAGCEGITPESGVLSLSRDACLALLCQHHIGYLQASKNIALSKGGCGCVVVNTIERQLGSL